ncbi:MAG: restriction endonuclease subunit S, partial [Pirellulaceae bacterium]|nr:restriction endonuclease subunit S [Pirellulaceae bacterium]
MSFPVYDEYKDSGYEWVGTVPNQWQVRRVKSLVAEPLKYGANESAEDEDRTQPRFVRITDIDDDGRLRDETFKSLPAEVAEPYLLRQGDVLLARSGATVGKSFIYSEEWGTACFAGYLIRARLRASECLPVWLYYFCQTDGYWGYVVGSQIQATIQNVSAEKYANLYLPLPPLDEQKAISSFLDVETSKIDALVSEQRRLIELLKEKRQAVISHAVTKGLNPNAPMKPSGIQWLGDVPQHWELNRVRYLAQILRGKFTHRPRNDPKMYDGPYPFIQTGE